MLLPIVMLMTGLLMMAKPRVCTKKEMRGDAKAEQKTRDMGKWVFVAGIIWVVAELII